LKDNQPKSKGGKRPGAGRPKGTPNKFTGELKDMILGALSDAGGQEYLKKQAEGNPGAFLTLIGKVLPMQVTGADGGPVKVEATWLAGRSV
jgi:hypothetical protein